MYKCFLPVSCATLVKITFSSKGSIQGLQFGIFSFLSYFSYSVIVQMVDHQREDTEKSAKITSVRELSWRQLCGVGRVNEHAAKVLSIFYSNAYKCHCFSSFS